MSKTFTVDAERHGRYYEDHGVSAEEVEAFRVNAPRLGFRILAVTEETPVSVSALRIFGVSL